MAVRRLTLVAIIVLGAAAYYGLMSYVSNHLPWVDIPAWWQAHWPSIKIGGLAWFAMLNAGAAVLAAIPISIGLVLVMNEGRLVAAIVVAAICALGNAVWAYLEYHVVGNTAATVTLFVQSLEIFTALPLIVQFVAWSRPPTMHSRGGI